jgi:hypothetical protein
MPKTILKHERLKVGLGLFPLGIAAGCAAIMGFR